MAQEAVVDAPSVVEQLNGSANAMAMAQEAVVDAASVVEQLNGSGNAAATTQETVVDAASVVEQLNGSANAAAAAVGFASFKPQLGVPSQKAEEALQFYKAAFGAEVLKRVNHPKRKADQELPLLICAELKIGSSSLLVVDQAEDAAAVKTAGSGGVIFRLETEDVEAAVPMAVKAGAVLEGEIAEEQGPCGGGLAGKVKDPFGHVWLISSVGKTCAVAVEP